MHWMPSPDLIAQLAHIFAGIACPLAVVAIFPKKKHILIWAVCLFAVYAATKEFIFDKFIEQQSAVNNAKDFLFYMTGVVGAVLLRLRQHDVWTDKK